MIFRSLLLCFCLFSLAACNSQSDATSNKAGADAGAMNGTEKVADHSRYQDITAEDFAAKMKDPNTVVLDVRTPGEIAKGKIDGAMELDYRSPTFSAELAKLDPNKTYLVYCAAGGRSAKACSMLDGLGATKVFNLEGGYGAWPK